MSQSIFSDINPATTSGNQLATLLNDFKDAVASGFSGTSRPPNLQAGGYWIDTTNDPTSWDYKVYNGTSDILIFTLNLSTLTATISNADSLFRISKTSADAVGAIIELQKKRVSGGGQSLANDVLGEVKFYGESNLSVDTLQARIKSVTQDNTTASAYGSYISFEVTPTTTSALAEVMRVIDSSVGIGTVAPTDTLHVKGTGLKVEQQADNTTASKVNVRKRRVSGSGQVLSGDSISEINSVSMDNASADVAAAQIQVVAAENHTASAHGSSMLFKIKKNGQTSYTTILTLGNTGVVATDLTVTNLYATNYYTGTVVEFADAQIIVNKGGNQAAANAALAGLRVEISGGTDVVFGYDSTLASKMKLGLAGSEVEVATVSHTQTFTNKTLTSPSIVTPTRLDTKQGTDAALVTYAATATNGQWCFATDTKVMYQVIDGALVPVGVGGASYPGAWSSPTTITIGATTTAPTKGTIIKDSVIIRQTGSDTFEAVYRYSHTSGGANGSGDYLISLPSGYSFNLTETPVFTGSNDSDVGTVLSQVESDGRILNSSLNYPTVSAHVYSSTQFRLSNNGASTTYFGSGFFNFGQNPLAFYAVVKFRGTGP